MAPLKLTSPSALIRTSPPSPPDVPEVICAPFEALKLFIVILIFPPLPRPNLCTELSIPLDIRPSNGFISVKLIVSLTLMIMSPASPIPEVEVVIIAPFLMSRLLADK